MDFHELVALRQSDRAYDANRPVEKEKIDRRSHSVPFLLRRRLAIRSLGISL